ncbi:LysR family transcriptional regulator [Pseudanabaena sp. PCC 6802]|uniref:LysR family transcriptional regulator n=1 Tax=Pseudanabaena sp. PCC 6802 TaxID=118173 RepID=UPI00034900F1|nr:LysR family transcriptional regulator [Pseudanabaena sp. PCC 6802]
MNLTSIDLNLLVVFDALMNERQVTRAGESIGLSQPATSNALARLRNLTSDELFIRTRVGLQPTPHAIAIAQHIQPALKQIQAALSLERNFDPMTSDRVFTIGMTDYVEFVLLPSLLSLLGTRAPNIKIQVRSGDRQHLLALLDSGEVDLICGLFPEKVLWHEEQPLFQEKYVCACRYDRPAIGDRLTLDDYLSVSHLLISIQEDMVGRVDKILAERNLKRHISISIPHFLVAPFILSHTDLIATLAKRVANEFSTTQNLKIFPCPLPIEGFSVSMRSHRSTHNHAAHVWLREIITEVARTI